MHTPGPWNRLDHFSEDKHDGHVIVGPPDDWHICAVWNQHSNGRTPEEVAANARLIAAAPDLLEACQAAIEEAGGEYIARYLDLCRAAIAQATGGPS